MTSRTLSHFAALAALSLLTACATTEGQTPTSATLKGSPGKNQPQQLKFKLASGTYRCELGKKVEIQTGIGRAHLSRTRSNL